MITTASGHSIAVTSGNRHKIDSVPVVFIHGVMVTYQFMTHECGSERPPMVFDEPACARPIDHAGGRSFSSPAHTIR